MWWLHVDLLMQLTIKKDIVDIKLRDRPVASKYHNEKCAKSGHVGHMRKCLVIVIAMFLLKATSHKTSLRRKGNEIPRVGASKSSNVLCHRMSPFG